MAIDDDIVKVVQHRDGRVIFRVEATLSGIWVEVLAMPLTVAEAKHLAAALSVISHVQPGLSSIEDDDSEINEVKPTL